jgi:hypothetical protein
MATHSPSPDPPAPLTPQAAIAVPPGHRTPTARDILTPLQVETVPSRLLPEHSPFSGTTSSATAMTSLAAADPGASATRPTAAIPALHPVPLPPSSAPRGERAERVLHLADHRPSYDWLADPARATYAYNMITDPGPLALMEGNPAANFAGGKYAHLIMPEDTVLYRAGLAGGGRRAFGQWFTAEPPLSRLQARIDSAIKPRWLDADGRVRGVSEIDAYYAARIPKGTDVYAGPVGSQGGIHVGGQDHLQLFIPQPWSKGVTIIGDVNGTPLP